MNDEKSELLDHTYACSRIWNYFQDEIDVKDIISTYDIPHFKIDDIDTFSPADIVDAYKNKEVILLLKDYMDHQSVNDKNETVLHLLFKNKHIQLVNDLLNRIMDNADICYQINADNNGVSLFHILCAANDSSYVEDFLKAVPVDINQKISASSEFCPGYTALHVAAMYYRYKTVKILIERGADIHAKSSDGLSLLHLACLMESPDWMYEEIAENFEDSTTIREKIGRVINHACFVGKNRENIIKIFIDYGGNIDVRDNEGNNALLHAAQCTVDTVYFDQVCGTFDNAYNKIALHMLYTLGLACIQTLLNHYIVDVNSQVSANPLNLRNYKGETCLHVVSRVYDDSLYTRKNQSPAFLKFFLEHDADVNAVDNEFRTPLHSAIQSWIIEGEDHCSNGTEKIITEITKLRSNMLLHVNAQDSLGNTALHDVTTEIIKKKRATYRDGCQYLWRLLKYGTDIYIENEKGVRVISLLKKGASKMVASDQFARDIDVVERDKNFERIDRESDLIISNTIRSYLVLLKVCNLYDDQLHENFLQMLTEELAKSKVLVEFNRAFEIACEEEVKQIQQTVLRRLLSRDMNKVARSTKDDELKDFVSCINLDSHFPMYIRILRARLAMAILRQSLLEEAKVSFRDLIGRRDFPDLCMDNIFTYLSEKKLRDIVACSSMTTEIRDVKTLDGDVGTAEHCDKKAKTA